MHIYGILIILLQVACAVHCLKTGRPYWWLFVILFFPLVGCIVYGIVEMLPDMRHHGRRAARQLAKTIDRDHDLKRHADRVAISGTVENKLNLAEECLNTDRTDEAIDIYQSCLTGIHRDDPKILLGLAGAHFQAGQHAETRDTLESLIKTHPDFKSAEGHLLYARALQELKETDKALEEYRVLAGYYPGLEAKCRYALMLKAAGRREEARELFDDIIRNARSFRGFYKTEKQWVDVARQEVSE